MDKKTAFLTLVVLGAAGYGIAQNWEAISRQLGLDDLFPGRIKAIDLTKSAFSLDSNRPNWQILEDRIRGEEIAVGDQPWDAEAIEEEEGWYEVTFAFTNEEEHEGRRLGFRANVNTMAVQYLWERTEAELAAKRSEAAAAAAPAGS